MKRDIYKEICAHTDANEHTEARICATAELIRLWDAANETRKVENPIRVFLGAFGTLAAIAGQAGHITPALAAVRERLWKATIKTAEAEGEFFAAAARRMNRAM